MKSFLESRELQAMALSRFGIGTASDWLSLPLDSEITLQDWAAVAASSFESYQFGNALFLDEAKLHNSLSEGFKRRVCRTPAVARRFKNKRTAARLRK
jgi:hypothetical protein